MKWLTRKEVKAAAKSRSLKAVIKCSIQHWTEIRDAGPVAFSKKLARTNRNLIYCDYCALCELNDEVLKKPNCRGCVLNGKWEHSCCAEWASVADTLQYKFVVDDHNVKFDANGKAYCGNKR